VNLAFAMSQSATQCKKMASTIAATLVQTVTPMVQAAVIMVVAAKAGLTHPFFA